MSLGHRLNLSLALRSLSDEELRAIIPDTLRSLLSSLVLDSKTRNESKIEELGSKLPAVSHSGTAFLFLLAVCDFLRSIVPSDCFFSAVPALPFLPSWLWSYVLTFLPCSLVFTKIALLNRAFFSLSRSPASWSRVHFTTWTLFVSQEYRWFKELQVIRLPLLRAPTLFDSLLLPLFLFLLFVCSIFFVIWLPLHFLLAASLRWLR